MNRKNENTRIKNNNFVTIQGWMINELKLKGNELLVYAIIYMFSQDGKSKFNGSRQYLADWCNSTRQGIDNCLKSLLKKGLIEKAEELVNGVKFVSYKTTKLTAADNKVDRGEQQSLHNNKEYTEDINKELLIKENIKEKEYQYFESLILEDAFKEFVKVREKKKKPLTERALNMLMKQLYSLSTVNGVVDEDLMLQIIERSIMHSWDSFYKLPKPVKQDIANMEDIDWGAL